MGRAGLGLRDKRKGFQDRARHVRPLLVECVNSQKPTYTRQKKGRAGKGQLSTLEGTA